MSASSASAVLTACPRYTRAELRRMSKDEARAASDELLRELRALDPADPLHGEIRAAVVELNMPLVRYVARAFSHRREPYDDILQTGVVGLLKAVDAYDVDRGVAFPSYALPTISGEIKRFFRDTSWPVHVTRGLQERFMAVARASDELEQAVGREPTEAEVAARLGLTPAEVREGREAGHGYLVDSLDLGTRVDSDGEGGPQARTPLADRLGYDDDELDLVDFRVSIAPLLSALPYRERRMIEMRFWHDLSQREIARRLGISQMHVSRLLSTTLQQLRVMLEEDPSTTGPESVSHALGPPGAAA
ncbi:SigB/SigF/SigG family RNA polymerase sigma factor [Yinghuangia seranimata]|uniref:SigB/SigF/SigG family RNA polymerase sigma factor n=1 Tax=Yinghuangia seranimata TaxID=408067 RepID=UPI00248B5E2C|nr:SigB/SigF/SigG family RNA polymerase sigma factor [Yinghuangia seranimata]MDI2125390.1 SigB/SigF/SigG family RNA polymerase sigma factor [Yinghuangia seranimata]